MNISDLFIIYLACGAPFGVYFFLQNRKKTDSVQLWLKSFLTVFVWIPYAFLFLNDFATKRNRTKQFARESLLDSQINEIQKRLLQIQLKAENKFSVFEFREILERYAGLTLACQSGETEPDESENEIFRISLRQNSQLGAKCLHRRNRKRLEFHQTLARQDFLQAVESLRQSGFESKEFAILAIEFVKILNDAKAICLLAEMFEKTWQNEGDFLVQDLEKEVWKSKEHKPLPANRISVPLTALTIPATRAEKD